MVLYSADEGSFKGGFLKNLGSKLQRKYRILTQKKKKRISLLGIISSYIQETEPAYLVSIISNKIRKKFPDLLRFFPFPFSFVER